jgi:hypothetical protein
MSHIYVTATISCSWGVIANTWVAMVRYVWLGGIYATLILSDSLTDEVIAATWAVMVRFVL